MALQTLNTIKDWFKTGLKPSQTQFWDTWDSFRHKNDKVPVAEVEGLDEIIDSKADKMILDNHLTDDAAHADLFNNKEDKNQKGAPDGYAPLDEFTKLAAQYLNIVNDLVTGGAESLLSAEQGKVLQMQVNAINNLLTSDNVNLDTLQELVDAVETVQASLSTILVNDLTTGGMTKALTAEMGKLLQTNKVDKVAGERLINAAEITKLNNQSGVNTGDQDLSNLLTLNTSQNVSALKTFLNGMFGLRNVANTFTSVFTNSNTASRTYTLPDKNGTVAMTSDIVAQLSGTVNRLVKFGTGATGTNSRIEDTGVYLGIGTSKTPLKDVTLGNQDNREIGIEDSSNITRGRDLTVSAGRTINYIENAVFNVLTPPVGFPSYGMCSTSSGNIYALDLTNKLLKQTGGSGSFVNIGTPFPNGAIAICSDSTNNLYVAIKNGDIYKQINETGPFIALNQTFRNWKGLCSLGGNIYASVFDGDIYRQTGGTGDFVALGQIVRQWGRMAASSTSIYVTSDSGIYKLTNQTGNFNLHSALGTNGIIVSNSNDIYINSGTDMLKQTNETGSFVSTGSSVTNNGIWGMATHANGNIYAGDFGNNVFVLQNNGAGTPNLDGGTFKAKAGTGKGIGKSRVEFYTGQKMVSGTDMQVETLRAEFNEEGQFKKYTNGKVNTQSGIIYTFSLDDAQIDNNIVVFTNSNPIQATIPASASVNFPIGSTIKYVQQGDGTVTTGGAGITFVTNLSLSMVKGETRILTKIDTNTWSVSGSNENAQIEVSTNQNVSELWNGKTILFTANCTITVPATLLSQYGFVFRTLAGVTVTWAITAPFTWETTPSTTPEKTTGSLMRRGNTNTILLDF